MRALAFTTLLLVAPLVWTAAAQADDATTALSELKLGYGLKQNGDCRAALPHFISAYRLSPSAKALLNAADCESRTGDLVSAKLHATQGRELTRQGHGPGTTQEDTELATVADALIASVDKRLARLTIKFAAGVPTDCKVVRDGVAVDAATIGTAVAANPGPHTITVKAPGRDDRTYDVSLADGQRSELLVDVGPPTSTLPANPYGQAPTNDKSTSGEAPSSLWATITATPRNEASAALVVGGVLAAFVGGAFGIAAISNNNASNANGHCDSTGCDAAGVSLRNTALSDATVSTILFGAGLAAIGGGVALYLTAPKSTTNMAALGVRGTW